MSAKDDAALLFKLIDALDDDDDVQTVWGNYEVSDAVMEKMGVTFRRGGAPRRGGGGGRGRGCSSAPLREPCLCHPRPRTRSAVPPAGA